MENTNYDIDYFIAKFEAIPGDKWCTGVFVQDAGGVLEKRCALGHCGLDDVFSMATGESKALQKIFDAAGLSVASVNDSDKVVRAGSEFLHFWQPTPKTRILAALDFLKTLQL